MKIRNRKIVSPETEIKILELHFNQKRTISELSAEFDLQPSSIYQSQAKLFQNGDNCFQRKDDRKSEPSVSAAMENKIKTLEENVLPTCESCNPSHV